MPEVKFKLADLPWNQVRGILCAIINPEVDISQVWAGNLQIILSVIDMPILSCEDGISIKVYSLYTIV